MSFIFIVSVFMWVFSVFGNKLNIIAQFSNVFSLQAINFYLIFIKCYKNVWVILNIKGLARRMININL